MLCARARERRMCATCTCTCATCVHVTRARPRAACARLAPSSRGALTEPADPARLHRQPWVMGRVSIDRVGVQPGCAHPTEPEELHAAVEAAAAEGCRVTPSTGGHGDHGGSSAAGER
eukprot:3078299-Prymnesium_polylepis.1